MVLETLRRYRVLDLGVERARLENDLAELEERKEQASEEVTFWARLRPFGRRGRRHETAGIDAELLAKRARFAVVREEMRRALAIAAREIPPIGLAMSLDRLLDRLRKVGMSLHGEEATQAALANDFDAFAASVASIWVKGFDADAFAQALSAGGPVTTLPPPQTDERHGFVPISAEELLSRSRWALEGARFEELRATVERETRLHRELTWELVGATPGPFDLASSIDALFAPPAAPRPRRQEAAARLAAERLELLRATENVHYALVEALGAFPPMRIHFAASAVAGLLRGRFAAPELELDTRTGGSRWVEGHFWMAMVFRAAEKLVATFVDVLPGISVVLGAHADDPALRRPAAPGQPPYRTPGRQDEAPSQPPPASAAALEASFVKKMDAAGVTETIDRAIAHGVMIDRARSSRADAASPLGKGLEGGSAELVAERIEWHRHFLEGLAREASFRVSHAASGLPGFHVRDALTRVAATVGALRCGSSTASNAEPFVFGVKDALEACNVLDGVLWNVFALDCGRSVLASAAAAHIEANPLPRSWPVGAGDEHRVLSQSELVVLLGETLRPTRFAVAWFKARTDPLAAVEAMRCLDEALEVYPPAAMQVALLDLRAAVGATRPGSSVETARGGEAPRVLGYPEVVEKLMAFTRRAVKLFGSMPTNGALVARSALAVLEKRDGGETDPLSAR